MKKILKKNQLIVTALAILIAVAGYLNFADSKGTSKETDQEVAKESVDSKDDKASGDSSQDAASQEPGEAVLVSGKTLVAQAKLNREQVRASNKESLMAIIDNAQLTQEEKVSAVNQMVELTKLTEQENACESMLESKGFESCVVTISQGKADVSVLAGELTEMQRAQIEDVVKRKTEIGVENIVINTMKDQ